MAKTSNFVLRTPPELKEVAKSLAPFGGLAVHHVDADGETHLLTSNIGSMNGAFNALIIHGTVSLLKEFTESSTSIGVQLEILGEIMRFFLDNPSAEKAFFKDFAENSSAHRLLLVRATQYMDDIEENDRVIEEAEKMFTAAERELWDTFELNCVDDYIHREIAARIFAEYQEGAQLHVNAKNALERALTAHRDREIAAEEKFYRYRDRPASRQG